MELLARKQGRKMEHHVTTVLATVGAYLSFGWAFLGDNHQEIAALCAIICTLVAVAQYIKKNWLKKK